MKVLGVSGSPIPNSNTDRAVKAILDATGLETEFIKLSDYKFCGCMHCLKCVYTNKCAIDDDGPMLIEKAREASAIVIGGWTPFSSLDSRTKAFIERCFANRHLKNYMKGKPAVSVVTHAAPEENPELPPAASMGQNAIMYYMMEEGMNYLGGVKVSGNVPCIRCGVGDTCEISGLKMLLGPTATVAKAGVKKIEDQPAMAEACKLGKLIAETLAKEENN
ncbi:MAG TPA: flavodoxin family protein [Methylomusa anaerophila]|uniref:NADPH-dependent FMN reductase n=1 Tax=Methylomusa anaerophila TaxID=1930071 RepID=A0A348AM03_9FIRM|nr:flavodoxin family protein [Methylomusa anaerophila]BBB92101.1 NADPH-dependent FMN reductase [Methylomusa anaerophila]HML87885.1 flavodoxin family protein [Methylomusa anaerophila]